LVFPESTIEKKISVMIAEYSNISKNEGKKLYFSIDNHDSHYGILYKVLDNKSNNLFFGTNFTKAETTFSRKNIELSEGCRLLKPYTFAEDSAKLYDNYNLMYVNDDRVISDEFNIQELFILSSIWFDDFKILTVTNKGYVELKNTERPKFIKDSVMEEFERELIKIKAFLNPKLFIDHETLFKQSITAILENPETFDLLEY